MLAQQVDKVIPDTAALLRVITKYVKHRNDTVIIHDILELANAAANNGEWSIEYAIRISEYDLYLDILESRGFRVSHTKGLSIDQLRNKFGMGGVGVFNISWWCENE